MTNDTYAVEDALTKMCTEMVNSMTKSKQLMDEAGGTENLQIIVGFQKLGFALEDMISAVQKSLDDPWLD